MRRTIGRLSIASRSAIRIDRPAPPWIISNPIYVQAIGASTAPAPSAGPARRDDAAAVRRSQHGWLDERGRHDLGDARSMPVQMVTGMRAAAAIRPRRADRRSASSRAPRSRRRTACADYDRVAFTIRAEHPMRVSIQVRAEVARRAARTLATIDLRRCHRWRAVGVVRRHAAGRHDPHPARRSARTSGPSCSSSTPRTPSPARRGGSGSRTCGWNDETFSVGSRAELGSGDPECRDQNSDSVTCSERYRRVQVLTVSTM